MRLIVGGSFQGKLQVARELLEPEQPKIISGEELYSLLSARGLQQLSEELSADQTSVIIADMHRYVRALLFQTAEQLSENQDQERSLQAQAAQLVQKVVAKFDSSVPQLILIMEEMGSGVVPMDAMDRSYREWTGRISCQLAAQASEVYRVVCGIRTRIK